MLRPFQQVDVFTATAYAGNPVAVVEDGTGLSTEQMQRFANWMNLSETTFLLPPDVAAADYQVRIFTPSAELPFAGHPTLGTCHAWLSAHDSDADMIVQQCPAGLIRIRRGPGGLAFAAPPTVRSGPVDGVDLQHIAYSLGIDRSLIVASQWVDNGPGWVAVMLPSAEDVLAVRPGYLDYYLGVVGPYPAGSPAAYEVRGFFPAHGKGSATVEDPVTGSLNASVAQWLVEGGLARTPYVASQGTALGRQGRIQLSSGPDGQIWVGGDTVTCITGEVDL
jgi:PhzF family phenazine biosynthesis protein